MAARDRGRGAAGRTVRRHPAEWDLTADDVAALDDAVPVLLGVCVVAALVCAFGVVVGVLVLRRVRWARYVCVGLAGITAVVGLLLSGTAVSVLWSAAAVVVIVMLFTGGANEWFARSRPTPPWPPAPPQAW